MADIQSVVETVTETTQTIASFVQTVADWIRQRNWINLICLILAIIILAWLSREGINQFNFWAKTLLSGFFGYV